MRKYYDISNNIPGADGGSGGRGGGAGSWGNGAGLPGDLGAGKTAFTRGLARGLGCRETVTSPTYTIVNEYITGRLPLFHFDMYRLTSAEDLWDIGWEDYLDRGGVCAVEWSENVSAAMAGATTVTFEKLGENTRRITLEGGEFLADLSL